VVAVFRMYGMMSGRQMYAPVVRTSTQYAKYSSQGTLYWVHCVVINPVLVLGVTFCRTALVAHLQDVFNVVLLVCVITVITISF